jgi:UDP-N-acetyl-D-galactosamine dehydrogenase
MGAEGVRALGRDGAVVYDVKYVLPRESVDGRL